MNGIGLYIDVEALAVVGAMALIYGAYVVIKEIIRSKKQQ